MKPKKRNALLTLALADFPASDNREGRFVQGGQGVFVLAGDEVDPSGHYGPREVFTGVVSHHLDTNSEGNPKLGFEESWTPADELNPSLVLFKAPCGMLFAPSCVHAHLEARGYMNRDAEDRIIPYPFDCEALDLLASVMAEYGWGS